MNKYSTILFDVDGTLLDFNSTQENALNKVFHNHNYLLNDRIRAIYNEINHGLWQQYEKGMISRDKVIYSRFVKLFQEVGIDGDGIAFEDEYQALLGQGYDLISGAIELLDNLSLTHELYIVTNGVTKTQLSRLRASKIDSYVKNIFVSEATGFQKPMKEYFEYCFKRIPGIEIERTIIVGDSLSSDILGGNNAGIDTCWFNPKEEICTVDVNINYEIKALAQLYDIVK